MNTNLFWVGGAIGVATNALSLVKLINHFLNIGFDGIPKFIIDSYSEFVAELQYWLVELPLNIDIPEMVAHLFIVWLLFAGSNYRFLTYKGIGASEGLGARLYRGFGDYGRGEKPPKSKWVVRILNVALSLTGLFFLIFVAAMWLCNRPGPSKAESLRDMFMIGNRVYSRKLSGIYMLILILAPVLAAILLVWGAAGSLV